MYGDERSNRKLLHRENTERKYRKTARRHLSICGPKGARQGEAQNEGKGGKIGNSESKVRQPRTTTAYATSRHETDAPDTSDRDEKRS